MSNDAGLSGRSIGVGSGAANRAAARNALVLILLAVATVGFVAAASADDLARRTQEIEAYLAGHPERALAELNRLASRANAEPASEQRFVVDTLRGQAMVVAGRKADALALATRLETDAQVSGLKLPLAAALLVRSSVQSSAGDSALANALAKQARELLRETPNPFLTHSALLAIGTTARGRGQHDEALANLQEALSLAEHTDNPYRRSSALYQLSVLYLALKQGDTALAESLEAFKYAEAAGSAYAMANARMAESAALELLEQPERELAAMEEALAIGRKDALGDRRMPRPHQPCRHPPAAAGFPRRDGALAPRARHRQVIR